MYGKEVGFSFRNEIFRWKSRQDETFYFRFLFLIIHSIWNKERERENTFPLLKSTVNWRWCNALENRVDMSTTTSEISCEYLFFFLLLVIIFQTITVLKYNNERKLWTPTSPVCTIEMCLRWKSMRCFVGVDVPFKYDYFGMDFNQCIADLYVHINHWFSSD